MTKKQMLIEERIQCLEQMVVQKEKELRKAPSGILKINKHGNGWQYYMRENEKDKNGKYIKKTNEKLIKSLAQKVYDEKVMKRAEAELNILKLFYHYEKPIILNGYGKVYPDFTLWDVKRGREIYWGTVDSYIRNFKASY